jgi:hypothetical protein
MFNELIKDGRFSNRFFANDDQFDSTGGHWERVSARTDQAGGSGRWEGLAKE